MIKMLAVVLLILNAQPTPATIGENIGVVAGSAAVRMADVLA